MVGDDVISNTIKSEYVAALRVAHIVSVSKYSLLCGMSDRRLKNICSVMCAIPHTFSGSFFMYMPTLTLCKCSFLRLLTVNPFFNVFVLNVVFINIFLSYGVARFAGKVHQNAGTRDGRILTSRYINENNFVPSWHKVVFYFISCH